MGAPLLVVIIGPPAGGKSTLVRLDEAYRLGRGDRSAPGSMTSEESVVDWLLEGDPAIRWQVMRDLLDRAV